MKRMLSSFNPPQGFSQTVSVTQKPIAPRFPYGIMAVGKQQAFRKGCDLKMDLALLKELTQACVVHFAYRTFTFYSLPFHTIQL